MLLLQKNIGIEKRFIFFLAYPLFLSCCLYAKPVVSTYSGEFIFKYESSAGPKSIKVYYYAPEKLKQNSRIVFVLHGASRNGAMYRNEWQKHAKKYNFLLLCPEFSENEFPGIWAYDCGNVYDIEKESFKPKEQWAFNVIEKLFDFVKDDRQIKVGSYCIFGHSAGAQFVQRMVLFMPEARFSLAIANGAGWYTMPSFEDNFHNGLRHSPVTEETLKKSFNKELIILMGDKDKVSKTSPPSYSQTMHKWDRVWRAKFFYKGAKAKAEQLGVKLNWLFKFVTDADHNDPKHALWGCRYAARSKKGLSNPKKPGEKTATLSLRQAQCKLTSEKLSSKHSGEANSLTGS